MKAVAQIIVHLESFKNIDLPNQGLYQLELSVSSSQGKVPPVIFESLHNSEKLIFNAHEISEGAIISASKVARSKIFMIRYTEERVKFNEVISFLLELPLSMLESSVTVQVNLLYMSVSIEQCSAIDLRPFKHINLKQVASDTFEVLCPISGINDFLPISFTHPWVSAVYASIHSVFLHYTDEICLLNHSESYISAEGTDLSYNKYVRILAEGCESIRKTIELFYSSDAPLEVPYALSLPLNANSSLESFSQIVKTDNPIEVRQLIQQEIETIVSKIQTDFEMLRDFMAETPRASVKILNKAYNEKIRNRLKLFIVRDSCSMSKKNIVSKSKDIWRSQFHANIPQLRVSKTNFFQVSKEHPLIFESKPTSAPSTETQCQQHLIVLVHGYQGISTDMNLYRNCLSEVYPSLLFLESSYNEQRTDEKIEEMGFRLAKEIITFLTEAGFGNTPRISFIGHSLGGIIIRAALPFLECLQSFMFSFVSLSAPHLGLILPSKLVNAGIWYLKRVRNTRSMMELTLDDFEVKEGCYMYTLSNSPGLSWFKHIMLAGAVQDDYVSNQSALVDPDYSEISHKMAKNILSSIGQHKLIRINASFKVKTSVDSFIGRSGHMKLIESQDFVRMIAYCYPELFK